METPTDRSPLHIRTPCPKRWEELQGSGSRRFCSECSLHVLDAARFTRREAEQLVSSASSRVCMRIEYDPAGAPVFAPDRLARLSRWAFAAGAALLAACQGGSERSADPKPVEPPSKMGRVAATHVMGDAAVQPPQPPATLGEAAMPQPTPPK